uniref:Uncharacterized protein n=1 Tax=Arundo donax TaxID=35708 RepID=A0A0A9BUF7_ARUDO
MATSSPATSCWTRRTALCPLMPTAAPALRQPQATPTFLLTHHRRRCSEIHKL